MSISKQWKKSLHFLSLHFCYLTMTDSYWKRKRRFWFLGLRKNAEISLEGVIRFKMCVHVCSKWVSRAEQSWAQRSRVSSIIYKSHTNDTDWTGSGRDEEHGLLTKSVWLLSPVITCNTEKWVIWNKLQSFTI